MDKKDRINNTCDNLIISIIISNHNGHKDTIELVQNLEKQTFTNYRIYIIDNNSKKESLNELLTLRSRSNLKIITLSEDNGWSYANNVGAKEAIQDGTDFLLFLNNDIVCDKDMIKNMVSKARKDTAVVAKMMYYYSPETIWYAGGKVSKLTCRNKHIGKNKADSKKYSKDKFVDFACFCGVLLSKEIYEDVGAFDEKFYLYYEDVDYSLRMMKKSYKILFVADAILWHKIGASNKDKESLLLYYFVRNYLYLRCYKYKVSNVDTFLQIVKIKTLYPFKLYCRRMLKRSTTRANIVYTALKDFMEQKMGRREESTLI